MAIYNNILVHSLVNIGDVLLSTSAVALLRKVYPKAKITMMVRPVAMDMLQNHPDIDEVLVYDYKGNHRSLPAQIAFLQQIKRRKFDLVISFDRKLRPALLSWLAGIPVRVVPDRVFDDVPSWVTRLYTEVVHIPFDLVNHLQADTYQEIVRQFCGVSGEEKPALGRLNSSHNNKASLLLSRLPKNKKKIGLCIKGTFALKNWPLDRFGELVSRLNEELEAAFFIIGAPEDKTYAAELQKQTQVPIANFCGETTLRDLAALLEQTDLFVTVDTGATHIAAATGVPMVVVYGCTTPRRWHPYNNRAIALSKEPECCPCSLGELECTMQNCLMKISVEEVYNAVMKLDTNYA